MAPIVEEVELKQWIFKIVSGSFGVCVEGALSIPRGVQKFWHSTRVIKRLSPKCLLTESGTVYILDGEIDEQTARTYGYPPSLIALFRKGFPPGWLEKLETFFKVQQESQRFNVSLWYEGCVSHAAIGGPRRRSRSLGSRRDSLPLMEAVDKLAREKQLIPLGRKSMLPPAPFSPIQESSACGDSLEEERLELREKKQINNHGYMAPKVPRVPGVERDVKEVELKNWVIKIVGGSSFGVCVEGMILTSEHSEKWWHSTKIAKRLSPRCLATDSGTVYILKGNMDKDAAVKYGYPAGLIRSFVQGFPDDWTKQLEMLSQTPVDSKKINVSMWNQDVISEGEFTQTRMISHFRSRSRNRVPGNSTSLVSETLPLAAAVEKLSQEKELDPNPGNVKKMIRKPLTPLKEHELDLEYENDDETPMEQESKEEGEITDDSGEATSTTDDSPEEQPERVDVQPRKPPTPQVQKKSIVVLRRWCFYMSRSRFVVGVEGRRNDMSGKPWWKSGGLVKRCSDGTMETTNGSRYKVEGPMDVPLALSYGYPMGLLNQFETGFPRNWQTLLYRFWKQNSDVIKEDQSVLKNSGLTADMKKQKRRLPVVVQEPVTREELNDDDSEVTPSSSVTFQEPVSATENWPPPLGTPFAERKEKRKKAIMPGRNLPAEAPGEPTKKKKRELSPRSKSRNRDRVMTEGDGETSVAKSYTKMRKQDFTMNMTAEQSALTDRLKEAGVNEDFKVSRSGRILKKPMAGWTGQRISYDVYGNIIGAADPTTRMPTDNKSISPDCSLEALSRALHVRSFTSSKQEQTNRRLSAEKPGSGQKKSKKKGTKRPPKRRSGAKLAKLVDYSINSSSDEEEERNISVHKKKKKKQSKKEKLRRKSKLPVKLPKRVSLSVSAKKRTEKEEKRKLQEKLSKKRWNNEELARLRIVLKAKKPESDKDWEDVARTMGGFRTAKQCIDKANNVLGYDNQRALEEQRKNESRMLVDITANRGTLAHQIQSRKFMESYARNAGEETEDFFEQSEIPTELAMPSLAGLTANDSLLPALMTPTNIPSGRERGFIPRRVSEEPTPAHLRWEKPETPGTQERNRRARYAYQLQKEQMKRRVRKSYSTPKLKVKPKQKKPAGISYRGGHSLMIPELDSRMVGREEEFDPDDSDRPEDYFSDDQE